MSTGRIPVTRTGPFIVSRARRRPGMHDGFQACQWRSDVAKVAQRLQAILKPVDF